MGRYLIPALAISSGLFQAMYVILDVYTAVHITSDAVVLSLLSVLIGFPLTIILMLIMSLGKGKKKIGKKLDPSFTGLRFPNRHTLPAFVYSGISGLFGTVGLFFYFWAASRFDPSVISPLMQFVILYLVVFDLYLDRELPEIVEIQSILMITLGAFLVTLNPVGFSLGAIIVVLVGLNSTSMLGTYFNKKAITYEETSGKRIDSLTLRTWFVFWMTVFTVVFSLFMLDFSMVGQVWLFISSGLYIVSASMTLAFLSFALYARALASAKMSIVNALLASSVLFSAIGSFVVDHLWPGILGGSNTINGTVWTVKFIGAILAMTGIIALSLSEIRLYILIRVLPGWNLAVIMKEIKNVRGIVHVSLISGTFDMVARAQLRALGRARTMIDQRLSKISGLEETVTFPIISEWERGY